MFVYQAGGKGKPNGHKPGDKSSENLQDNYEEVEMDIDSSEESASKLSHFLSG